MSLIEVKDAGKTFARDEGTFTAFEHIDLSIERGEFICLLGPSGCGKSTLLNAMAGFDLVTSGSITIDGREVREPSDRYVTIFQNYGLLPWRSVQKNVELGLEQKGLSKAALARRSATSEVYLHQVFSGRRTPVSFAM